VRGSSDRRHREELVESLRRQVGRDFGNWTVAFTQAAAEHLGLNAPDLGYLATIAEQEPLTAGRLAQLTGLTTGAITGVIDRLERDGFVRREPDPADRRRVIVRTVPERMREGAAVFASSQQAWVEMSERYSDDELAFAIEFMRRSTEVLKEETAKLRAQTAADGSRRPASTRAARRTR
jgi:DNA-binding MarR family transcriptional regulator